MTWCPGQPIEEYFLKDPSQHHHLAALYGDIPILKELIQSGSDKDQDSAFGTPLHVAIFANQIEAVRLLVDAGADLEALHPSNADDLDDPVSNSLRIAVCKGNREIFRLLWDAGAAHRNGCMRSYGLQENFKQSSLIELAAFEDHPDIAMDLLSLSDKWIQTEKDRALFCAARVWSAGCVGALLRTTQFSDDMLSRSLKECSRGSPKSFNNYKYIPTWKLKESVKQAETIKHLLNAYREEDCAELLHSAAIRPCCIETLCFLLQRGVDPNSRVGKSKSTPLHKAVVMQYTHEVNKAAAFSLLQYGADPNIPDAQGMTALHWAVELGGDLELIKKLLEAGVNAAALDNEAVTPMILAAYSPFYENDEWRELQVQILVLLLGAVERSA
ncbi:ankyrin [Melanomma pulvis-pyrius CBS 109.77]|uniref:Ankyrin n=1 Tax=Melanomma pulvis-pyrius CBS 109.77 TaxID=1314802 RepID=A0A6A6XD83_9PLEO|nr:ankyrin [Melanomma pulvis-pyrius CBS 109.77]